jgi:hypothetical protein
MSEALAIVSVIIGSISLIFSCAAIAIIVGFKNSTHKIEWRALDSDKINASGEEELNKILEKHLNGFEE